MVTGATLTYHGHTYYGHAYYGPRGRAAFHYGHTYHGHTCHGHIRDVQVFHGKANCELLKAHFTAEEQAGVYLRIPWLHSLRLYYAPTLQCMSHYTHHACAYAYARRRASVGRVSGWTISPRHRRARE